MVNNCGIDSCCCVWPNVQAGINEFLVYGLQNLQESAPILAPFLFGTLERLLLLPFGLHHMLDDSYQLYTARIVRDLYQVHRQDTSFLDKIPLWLAWATDLIES